jgi:hypothetical protein
MNMKKTLLGGLLALATVAFSAGTANAQTSLSGDIFFSVDSQTGNPVQGSSGSYHVTLDWLSTVAGYNKYQFTITGNNDGVSWPGGVPVPGTIAKTGVDLFTLNSWSTNGDVIRVSNDTGFQATGLTNSYVGPVGGNRGGDPGQPSYYGTNAAGTSGSGGGIWLSVVPSTFDPDVPSNGEVQWTADSALGNKGAVAPHGGNTFTGFFYTEPGQTFIQSADVSMQDHGEQWSGHLGGPVVPEPGSLALLLPGLMPLGMVLRRRRSSR